MQIFFTKEQEPEKRICVLPETVKRFIDLGIDVAVEKDIGLSLFITNDLYSEIGAEIVTDKDSCLSSSDIVCRINKPKIEEISILKEGSLHISFLDPFKEVEIVNEFVKA